MTTLTDRPGYTGIYQTPPLPVRDAAVHVARTFEDAPVAFGVPAACRAAASSAQNDVEKRLAETLALVGHSDAHELAMRVNDVGGAHTALVRHEATTGHDECCGDNCDCTFVPGPRRPRCETCETAPHELLDHRVSLLLEVPARRLGKQIHDQLFAAAAAQ